MGHRRYSCRVGPRDWIGDCRPFWSSCRYKSQSRRFGLLERLSRFIGQPLALDAEQRAVGAGDVVIAGLDPVRVAEIKFGEIAVKMALGAMLIDTDHAAFEDAEIAFGGIDGDNGSGHAVTI